MCQYWCWDYAKCPHLGKLNRESICEDKESIVLLLAKGYGEGDRELNNHLDACEENSEVEQQRTYGACDVCLRNILAEQVRRTEEVSRDVGKENTAREHIEMEQME